MRSDLLIILCYLAIVFAVCVVADILVKIVWSRETRVSRFLDKVMFIPDEETEEHNV